MPVDGGHPEAICLLPFAAAVCGRNHFLLYDAGLTASDQAAASRTPSPASSAAPSSATDR
jgi:hypothetical protein